MKWKYYIPHVWHTERTTWENVYLLPDSAAYDGRAIWLTVDALGFFEDTLGGSEEEQNRVQAERKLGDREYWIEGTDMIVRASDFTQAELLSWVRVWLQDNGLRVTNLVEASAKEFRGRAFHADWVEQLRLDEGSSGA